MGDAMNSPERKLHPSLLKALIASTSLVVSGTTFAALTDIVFVQGRQTDSGTDTTYFGSVSTASVKDLVCETIREFVQDENFGENMQRLETENPAMADLLNMELETFEAVHINNYCNSDPDTTFNIIYTNCSMTMWSGADYMKIVLPPATDKPYMITYPYVVDPNSNQQPSAVAFDLQTPLTYSQVSPSRSDETMPGVMDRSEVTPGGETSEHIGYPTSLVNFSYSGRVNMSTFLGGGGQGPALPGGLGQIDLESEGYAWVSTEAPGIDVIQAFYDNFANSVQPPPGGGTLMSSMIEQMAGITAHGLPLAVQTNSSVTMQMSILGESKQESASATEIRRVRAITAGPNARCERPEIPPGYQLMTMGEGGLSGGDGAPGGQGLTAEQQQQVNEGMAEFNEAMQNLTPEQQEALSGLSGLIPGLSQGQPAAAPAGASANSSRSASRSTDLMTDNMVQSVQLHLQALGIEPGNTSGEMDLNTQIAISQFQASKGMKPTGEASPQLLGILAAEVDK